MTTDPRRAFDPDQISLIPDLAPEPPRCEICRAVLDLDARVDARFCSTTCRVRAHRRDQKAPAHLTDDHQTSPRTEPRP